MDSNIPQSVEEKQQNRFVLPQLTTQVGLDFLFASYQARGLTQAFAQALQQLDDVRGTAIMLLSDHDPEKHSSFINEHRQEILTILKNDGIDDVQAEHITSTSINFVAHIAQQSRTATKVFGEHLQYLLNSMLARGYDVFYIYAEEILRAIFAARMVDVDAGKADINALLNRLVQDHLKDLTKSGHKDDLYKELRDELSLSWLPTQTDQRREKIIAAIRNIITHKRGIIETIP